MMTNNFASQSTEARNSAIFTVSAYFASENIYKDMNITDDTFNEFYLSSNSLFTFICKALTSSKTYATFYITYGANRYEFSLSKDYYSGNYSINVLDWGNSTDGYEVTLSADIKRIGNKNVAVIAKAIISEIVRHYDAFNEALYMEENATINEAPSLNEAPTLEDTPMLEDDVVNRVVDVIKEYYNNYLPSYLDQFGECVITVYWNRFSEADMMMLIENEEVALAVRDVLLSDNVILDKNGFLVYDDGVYLTVDYNKMVNRAA